MGNVPIKYKSKIISINHQNIQLEILLNVLFGHCHSIHRMTCFDTCIKCIYHFLLHAFPTHSIHWYDLQLYTLYAHLVKLQNA